MGGSEADLKFGVYDSNPKISKSLGQDIFLRFFKDLPKDLFPYFCWPSPTSNSA